MPVLTPDTIAARARALGFDLCGVAPIAPFPELAFLREWLDAGYAGEMHYLARSADTRSDISRVVEGARSVIALATNYHTDRPYSIAETNRDTAAIARYAWGDDYHDVILGRLDALVAWMREQSPTPFDVRRYVDTGPVQERVAALHAGLGWIGKNTCLINEQRGSWLFLSVIVSTLALPAATAGVDRCGTCTLCLEACPTQAFVAPYVLDARRCLSYVTIERKGDVPDELLPALGSHVFGCDVCQEVCPYNQSPLPSADDAWQPRPAFDRPSLEVLEAMSDEEWRAALKGSPMRRSGRSGLRRALDAVRRGRAL